eukprot:scaffold33104_cov18-Tisochrysis_lutea.AAC.1
MSKSNKSIIFRGELNLDRKAVPWSVFSASIALNAEYKDKEALIGSYQIVCCTGEDEMWTLARRLSGRFPSLLETPYLPHRFPVVSSQ